MRLVCITGTMRNTYFCDISLDEDEMEKFLTDTFRDCPYYLLYDEYAIVRKQN